MKADELLPLGSIVLLKDASKKLIITGYYALSDSEKMYDYCALLYPEGFISQDKFCLFNHNQIDKVFFIGYSDIERENFIKKLNESISAIQNESKNVEIIENALADNDFEQI